MPATSETRADQTPSPEAESIVPEGTSVYQDVVLGGVTRARGVRDCDARWQLIAPHLHDARTVLDLGSGFGWFGLQLIAMNPSCVVASIEGDRRTASVQQQVLDSNSAERICLLTRTATHRLFRGWRRRGQRFDAALLLSVLHWLPDHRALLGELGGMTRRLFVECPHPEESEVGIPRVARAIGKPGEYLRALFGDRPVVCLGTVPGLPQGPYEREVWMVGPSPQEQPAAAHGLDVGALLSAQPAWPSRRWWQSQLARLCIAEHHQQNDASRWPKRRDAPLLFTPDGLATKLVISPREARRLARRIARLPDTGVPNTLRSYFRSVRRRMFS